MQDRMIITREQVLFLTFLGVIGNMVYSHTWIDNPVDRAAWVATLLGILLLIPFSMWLFYLAKFYPGSTILDIVEKCMGKPVRWIISLLYILINTAILSAQLVLFTQMLNVFFLRNTPSVVIILVMVLIGALIANSEIRVIGRLVEFLAVLGLLNYLSSFAFAFPKFFNIKFVIPIFDTTLPLFIKGSIFMTGAGAECLILFMTIVCYIPNPAKHYMWVVKGIILSAVIFALAILIIMAMMSPELAKRIAFGGVNAAKLIHIGEFIHGLEVLVFGTYQFIAMGKTALSMFCILSSIKKMFNLKKNTLPLFITVVISFIPPVLISTYSRGYYLAVALGSYVLLPFSIFVLSIVSIGIFINKKKIGSAAK